MKKISIWNYIWLGSCLRFMQDQRVNFAAKGTDRLLGTIESFLNNLDTLELNVTKRAANDLELYKEYLEKKHDDYNLSYEDVDKITSIASDVRKTFVAETQEVFAYVVGEKRLSVNKLLENVEKLFAPDTFAKLPDIARYDFQEAGKCIAFNRATAAAFHILRGMEKVVFLYYKRHIRSHKKGVTWGQMMHALDQKKKGKLPDPVILSNLEHVGVAFGNPSHYPEKIYDIHEVQDLFSSCIDAVNRIMKEIS